jgi:hypothetical protein
MMQRRSHSEILKEHLSHAAIQDLIKRGKLAAVEVGGRRFLRRTDVENFGPELVRRPTKTKGLGGTRK